MSAPVCFEFTQPHINAGTLYQPGDRIDLPENKANRLRDFGAGQIVEEPTETSESPDPSPKARKRRK